MNGNLVFTPSHHLGVRYIKKLRAYKESSIFTFTNVNRLTF